MATNIKRINYKIQLLSPVLVSSTVGDENMTLSYDFIGGTSLLGILANRYIKEEAPKVPAHQDPVFKQWFLSDKLCFLNGYITNPAGKRGLPIPRSIQFRYPLLGLPSLPLFGNRLDCCLRFFLPLFSPISFAVRELRTYPSPPIKYSLGILGRFSLIIVFDSSRILSLLSI